MDHIGVGATCLDAKRGILYCVHEFMTQPGYFRGGGGLVYALKINPNTGDLTELNHQPSYGSLPAYVAVDLNGKYLISVSHTGNTPITRTTKDASGKYKVVVEYDEAGTVLFRLNKDGSIGDPCDIYKHVGSGPDTEQTHARLHSVMMSPSGSLFAVCDKGSDKLYFFGINPKTEKLEVRDSSTSFSGSLPRYGAFHPSLPYFYMNHEVKPVVSAFRYTEAGKLTFARATSVLPAGMKEERGIMQSDIRVHPSGKYVYALIRGIDSVSVLAVQEGTGELDLIQTVPLEGSGRGCAISPDGRYLYAALTAVQKVSLLTIGDDGKVTPTGRSFTQPNPGNLTFFQAPS
jgi:6-phosphogluconolactonase (cycloisomerase 2 family)